MSRFCPVVGSPGPIQRQACRLSRSSMPRFLTHVAVMVRRGQVRSDTGATAVLIGCQHLCRRLSRSFVGTAIDYIHVPPISASRGILLTASQEESVDGTQVSRADLVQLITAFFSQCPPRRRGSEEIFSLVCSLSDSVHSCEALQQIRTTVTRHYSGERRSRARHRLARNRVGANRRRLRAIGSVTPKGGRTTTSAGEVCTVGEESLPSRRHGQ